MAATVLKAGAFVQLTVIDADWTWTTTFPNHPQGIKVDWIAFKPINANDKLSVKMDSDAGPECFPSLPRASASDAQIVYYDGGGDGSGNLLRPVIDVSASQLGAGHQVTIKLMTNSGD